MTQGLPIDRPEIHLKIWNARDRSGKVKIYQKQLALHLRISAPQLCRIIKEFETSGRIKKVGSTYRNVGVYVVRDPADFPPSEKKLKSTGLGPASQPHSNSTK